jgi:hypothetical protein
VGIKRALYRRGATAAAVALVASGLAVDTGLAQTAPPTPVSEIQRTQDFLAALAARLRITPPELQAAVRAAEKDLVDQDAQAGRITQAEAVLRKQLIDQAPVPRVIDDDWDDDDWDDDDGWEGLGDRFVLAQFLGAQPAEVRLALRMGKPLAQLAQERGKTRDQLKAFLTQQHKAQLDRAVRLGRLTQQGADLRMADFASRLDRRIDRMHFDD